MRLRTLVVEDLRAMPRQTFGLGALAVLLTLGGFFAYATAHGEGGLAIYIFLTLITAPLLVAVVMATRIASSRRSRFVDSLYTTPLTQRTWLASQLIVGAVLVLALMAASSPFLLVYLAHLPPTGEMIRLLGSALLAGAFAVALGIFAGVIVGDAGPGAAASIAGGGAIASFLGFFAEAMMVNGEMGALQPNFVRLTHVSPLTLAVDATGGSTLIGVMPDSTWGAALGLAVMIAFFLGAGWIAYTRQQGPLGWESQRGRAGRWAIVVLAVVAILTPVATASVAYHDAGGHGNITLQNDETIRVSVVARGTAIADEAITELSTYRTEPMVFGHANDRDVLVALRVPTSASVSSLRVQVDGGEGYRVVGGLDVSWPAPAGRAHETRGFGFPGDPVGEERNVYRVPVTITPIQGNALLESRANVLIHVTAVVNGAPTQGDATLTLTSDMPGAGGQVLAASAPIPLACVGGLVARKIRTR